MKESQFQANLIKELENRFWGCIVIKNDPNYIQGFPDLLILHDKMWAALECKISEKAARQPNQEHYIQLLDKLSFAAFIYPENKEEVLDELQHAFQSRW